MAGFLFQFTPRPFLFILLKVYICLSVCAAQTTFQRTYGGTGNDFGYSVQQTSDGGYIIAGETRSFGANSGDVYLIKVNSFGDTLWTRTYGGTNDDFGYSVRQTSDGGYIIGGGTDPFGTGLNDVYLIRTNSSGDTLWTKTYGGANGEFGYSVQQTSDSGYIIGGGTLSFGAGSRDVYLIKVNSSGDTLWTKTYGSTNYEEGYSVQQTSDSGYIVAGETREEVYLIKVNSSGDTLWTKTYGGANYDFGSSVQQTSDGGYIISGGTSSFGPGVAYDVYLIRTNSSGDTLLWTRTYGSTDSMKFDVGYSVQQVSDAGFIIAGWTNYTGPNSSDVFIIKTRADGLVPVHDERKVMRTGFTLRQNYPNPFNPSTIIVYRVGSPLGGRRESVSLRVYDLLGRELATLVEEVKDPGTYQVEWDGSGSASGVYFYRLQAGGYSEMKKLVLLR